MVSGGPRGGGAVDGAGAAPVLNGAQAISAHDTILRIV
jgi:hypothetical protein